MITARRSLAAGSGAGCGVVKEMESARRMCVTTDGVLTLGLAAGLTTTRSPVDEPAPLLVGADDGSC